MKKINYDRVALEERRRNCEEENKDVLVWTNERVIKWINDIGLKVSSLLLCPFSVHPSIVYFICARTF